MGPHWASSQVLLGAEGWVLLVSSARQGQTLGLLSACALVPRVRHGEVRGVRGMRGPVQVVPGPDLLECSGSVGGA